jgi:hypothetical protein
VSFFFFFLRNDARETDKNKNEKKKIKMISHTGPGRDP